ncbi:helicase associated domain-containing protein [Streptomyces sp. NPDC007818]|uniref:helicase associated domain-containing protein n=1 Tax=Streptomyces sp. NPDC007818 TaxID=3364780 RepID=UPI0036891F4A
MPSEPSQEAQAQQAERAEAAWQKGLAAAVAFHREHGHLRVPVPHVRDGIRLDAWLYRQRKAHKEGALLSQHVRALDDLGIRWTTDARRVEHPHVPAPASPLAPPAPVAAQSSPPTPATRRASGP